MNLVLGYISLLLAQAGTSAKQYAMTHCGRRAPGAFNSVCINMMRAVICLVVSLIIWLSSGGGVTNLSGHIVIVISGIGTALNLFTWILASRLISLTLIDSLSMIGSMIIPMFLAPYMFKGESVSICQWIGCALVFVAVFLFMNKDKGEKAECSPLKKFCILFFCVLGTGVTTIFKKYFTFYYTAEGLGNNEYFTFISFVTVVVFFAMMFVVCYRNEYTRVAASGENGAKVEFPYKKVWGYVLVAAVALYVNELFTVYAQGNLPSAVYLPLSKGLVVSCCFLLDVIAFKDKVTLKKLIGLAVIIVAVVLVNL